MLSANLLIEMSILTDLPLENKVFSVLPTNERRESERGITVQPDVNDLKHTIIFLA